MPVQSRGTKALPVIAAPRWPLFTSLAGFDVPIRELWHRSGQRVVYCVHYAAVSGRIDVIDAFEKDSREGKTMRKSDKERIERRVAALKREMEELEERQRAGRRLH